MVPHTHTLFFMRFYTLFHLTALKHSLTPSNTSTLHVITHHPPHFSLKQIHTNAHSLTHTHICVCVLTRVVCVCECVHVFMYVCVCVCVCSHLIWLCVCVGS